MLLGFKARLLLNPLSIPECSDCKEWATRALGPWDTDSICASGPLGLEGEADCSDPSTQGPSQTLRVTVSILQHGFVTRVQLWAEEPSKTVPRAQKTTLAH